MICLSIVKNVLNTTFELVNRGGPFLKTHALLIDGLDKVLCGMRKSLITETCYEVSIVFRKESYINAKKVLSFIQSLTNEKKVIKP